MKISQVRIKNFQSFGSVPTTIGLDQLTYVLGPNGAGKTAVLEALSRLFSPLSGQRAVRLQDFHVPVDRAAEDVHADLPMLWVEADLEFPEAADEGQHASIPPNFQHMAIETKDGVPRIRVRLTAVLAIDGEIEETINYVLQADEAGEPASTAEMPRYDRGQIEVHYLPARRDPTDHISYTAASLIGRTLRAADWSRERDSLANSWWRSLRFSPRTPRWRPSAAGSPRSGPASTRELSSRTRRSGSGEASSKACFAN